MANFNIDDYVSVNTRIEKFWEKYPDGRISTEIVKWEAGVITMKASVYKNITDSNPTATGHAYETEGASFINKTSAVENCETSVVGRALALMGFEVKNGVASKEEVANAIHQQNIQEQEVKKPTPPKQSSGNDFDWAKLDLNKIPTWETINGKRTAPKIIKRLFAIQKEYGIASDEFKDICKNYTGKEHSDQWTYGDIKGIEETLNTIHDKNTKEVEQLIDEPEYEEFAIDDEFQTSKAHIQEVLK